MKRNVKLFINDILDSIDKIESFSKGLTKEGLSKDNLRQYAIVRAIEIIGEAVKSISDDLKKDYPGIPWKEIIGMRDVVIHSYFKLDLEKVWKTIKEDIPELKQKILKIKEDLE